MKELTDENFPLSLKALSEWTKEPQQPNLYSFFNNQGIVSWIELSYNGSYRGCFKEKEIINKLNIAVCQEGITYDDAQEVLFQRCFELLEEKLSQKVSEVKPEHYSG